MPKSRTRKSSTARAAALGRGVTGPRSPASRPPAGGPHLGRRSGPRPTIPSAPSSARTAYDSTPWSSTRGVGPRPEESARTLPECGTTRAGASSSLGRRGTRRTLVVGDGGEGRWTRCGSTGRNGRAPRRASDRRARRPSPPITPLRRDRSGPSPRRPPSRTAAARADGRPWSARCRAGGALPRDGLDRFGRRPR